MSEFAGMDDWGLQAVVRGFTNDFSTTIMDNPPSCFAPSGIQQDDLHFSLPDLFETTRVLDELEELYKPFYPVLHPLSPQTINITSISVPREEKEPQKQQQQQALAGSAIVATATTARAAQSKRRKNQHKRVVHQVTSDGLSSDVWAWRKYGQKPIKGSPYPRSYYRCSSSKGCLARKQVERSRSDPGMFIVTYTAEHSHAHPTRRKSLAGSSRRRLSEPKRPTTSEPDIPTINGSSCSQISTAVLSPTTPIIAIIEDEFLQHASKQESKEEEEEQTVEEGEDNEIVIPDMILSSDLFLDFEELDGLTSNLAFDHFFSNQFMATFPC